MNSMPTDRFTLNRARLFHTHSHRGLDSPWSPGSPMCLERSRPKKIRSPNQTQELPRASRVWNIRLGPRETAGRNIAETDRLFFLLPMVTSPGRGQADIKHADSHRAICITILPIMGVRVPEGAEDTTAIK